VAGLTNAENTEDNANTATPLLVLAACPVDNRPAGAPRLWGKLDIRISGDSMAFSVYQKMEIEEPFNCNYELNPAFRGRLERCGLKVSGISADGSARIIELPDRRFYIATGFQPQLASEAGRPHPLIIAWLKAAMDTI
jgi:CTP synthase (UTP-ammonia lyase)